MTDLGANLGEWYDSPIRQLRIDGMKSVEHREWLAGSKIHIVAEGITASLHKYVHIGLFYPTMKLHYNTRRNR